MALSREAYKALEDIVGPDNISEEPAIMYSYTFMHGNEAHNPDLSKFWTRPVAVLLPGSTEEVQSIVKTCNTYGVTFKAFSTGWFRTILPANENTIQLDLRRMNRILEIDKKNMFALVEPYVIAGTLQAEAMKLGLNCNMIGAGASASPLACSCLGLPGHGGTSLYMGHSSEVLLAMEWVMPNGDILRTGSSGSRLGWFCGEGPGPSLRGIAKGLWGHGGSLGVFTKAAIKLSPWPGPDEFPVEDKPPGYKTPVPDHFRVYTVAFKSWQDMANSYYKIWDNEIGYYAHRQFVKLGVDLGYAFWVMYATDPTQSLDNLEEWSKKPEIQRLIEESKISYQIVLAGNSLREIEYQDKVFDKILADTGGWKVARMSEPDMEKFSFCYLIRMGHKNLNFVYTCGRGGQNFNQYCPPDALVKQIPVFIEKTRKYQETGQLVSCGDALMGCVGAAGGGTYCIIEQFNFNDPTDKHSIEGGLAMGRETKEFLNKNKWTSGIEYAHKMLAPREKQRELILEGPQPEIYHWQWKIKQMLDTNNITDISYVTLEKPPKE